MNKIALFIGLLSCATSEVKPPKIVARVHKTVNCAFDEAEVLHELTMQCKNMFKEELKKFRDRNARVKSLK